MTRPKGRNEFEEFMDLKKHEDRAFDEFLEFIDEIPDPPSTIEIPFPYGTDQPRPYGWSLKRI